MLRLILLGSILLSGCFGPSVRPMRAKSGASATFAAGYASGSSGELKCGDNECWEADGVGEIKVQTDIRYGHVSGPWGITSGTYLSGGSTSKRPDELGALMVYGQGSYQTKHLALTAGLDLGANAIGPIVGFELRGDLGPTLTAFMRRLHPLSTDAAPNEYRDSIEVATTDVGLAIRFGPSVFQYTYYKRDEGREFLGKLIAPAEQASSFHIFTAGFEI